MQTRLHDQLQALGLGKNILLAASGGLDSTVLLHLLLKLDYKVSIAHANFQLRGKESDADEAWIRQLASDFQVPFYTQRFETNNYAMERKVSVQMAARDLRYAWFDRLCDEHQLDHVATAHHLNDNLETVIANFTRGTGLSGLLGIPQQNGRIIRPLLSFTRTEIECYARENNIAWREDASNASDDYGRNFIRHQVIPKLKELNPSLEETFGRNTERLHAAEELVRRGLSELTKEQRPQAGNRRMIPKTLIESFSHPAGVLMELIRDAGFNLDQCREIVLAAKGQAGKQFFSLTHALVVDRDELILSLLQTRPGEIQIEEGIEKVVLGAQVLRIGREGAISIKIDNTIAMVDREKLQFPLTWRAWRPGDSFFPLGMTHRKKLSDFLIDNKISLPDKQEVTVLESGGEIVWVVGHRVDNRFKKTDSTKVIWIATVSPA